MGAGLGVVDKAPSIAPRLKAATVATPNQIEIACAIAESMGMPPQNAPVHDTVGRGKAAAIAAIFKGREMPQNRAFARCAAGGRSVRAHFLPAAAIIARPWYYPCRPWQ
jgi:hypothetical protein